MTPSSIFRWSTRLRPFGLGGSNSKITGSIRSHRSSGISHIVGRVSLFPIFHHHPTFPYLNRTPYLFSLSHQSYFEIVSKTDGSDLKVLALRGEKLKPRESGAWDPSRQQEACSQGKVVPDTKEHPGLVQDCKSLLRLGHGFASYGKVFWGRERSIMAEWRGVNVDQSSNSGPRVTGLLMEDYGLTGPIPPELGRLENLRVLNLRNNRLEGSIPAELENLRNLALLDLRGNPLTGCIPGEFADNRKLEILSDGLVPC